MVRARVNVLLFSTVGILLLCAGVHGQQVRADSSTSSIDKTIGVVVLNPKRYPKNSLLRFLNKDGSLWYQYSFYGDAGVPSSTRADFKPFAFHPDYFLLVVKCVKRNMDRWEVIVNEATGLTKFVRVENQNLKFETWIDHISTLFAVNFDQTANPIRTSPSDRANSIPFDGKMFYRPVQIRGNWLKIRAESPEKVRLRSGVTTGWIKWRDAKHLLIQPLYFS